MDAPIGTIIRELEHAVRAADPGHVQAVYEEFDRRHWNRDDYRLWRSRITPYFSVRAPHLVGSCSALSAQWGEWQSIAMSAVNSDDRVVLWSTVALAPDLLRTLQPEETCASRPIWPFLDRLYGRLRYELRPLVPCPASCGIAAAIFIVSYGHFYQAAEKRFSPADALDLTQHLATWLKAADPDWIPGQKLNTDLLEVERKKRSGRLRVGHDAFEYAVLVGALKDAHDFIECHVTSLNPPGRALLQLAYDFARSAWRTARSCRLSEIEHQKTIHHRRNFSESRAKATRRTAVLTEFDCLIHVFCAGLAAANDQIDRLQAVLYAYLALRFIPDEFVRDPHITSALRQRSVICRYIKEAGLEVDDRFRVERLDACQDVSVRGFRIGVESTLVTDYHQRTWNEWQILQAEFPPCAQQPAPLYLLQVVRRLADAGGPASPQSLAAILVICFRYGFIRSAAKIIQRAVYHGHFAISKTHLLDFVHSIRRCMTLEPFGMRHEKVSDWKMLVIDACEQLRPAASCEAEWFTADELLWIHETLIGRTHVHQRSLPYNSASHLYAKCTGLSTFAEMRNFYDTEYKFWRRPKGVATSEVLSSFCRRYAYSRLGQPVMLSVLTFRTFATFLAVGASGRVSYRVVPISEDELDEQVASLVSGAEFWFRCPSVPLSEQVDAPSLIEFFAGTLVEMASECEPGSTTVVLSAEPNLLQLPWQYLLRRAAQGRRSCVDSEKLLVSLVPNLGMLPIDNPGPEMREGIHLVLGAGGADEDAVNVVADAVRRSVCTANGGRESVCIVVGHGAPAEEEGLVPEVSLGQYGRLKTIGDWREVLRSRHVVLHCCHAGGVRPIFMRELGGIPGAGLALGADSFLAPVTEVSASTAITLQEEIALGCDALELGERYLRAINRDPSVMLYNLYGSPYSTSPIIPEDARDGAGNELVFP